jgi:hypothetical protein
VHHSCIIMSHLALTRPLEIAVNHRNFIEAAGATLVVDRAARVSASPMHHRAPSSSQEAYRKGSDYRKLAWAAGDTLVVDGAAWMWRQPVVPRQAVSRASRGVEAKSRAIGVSAAQQRSKL